MSEPLATPAHSSTVEKVLGDAKLALSVLAEVGVLNPAAAGLSALLGSVLGLAQQAIATHNAITGVPLDPAALHHVDPVP